MTNQSAEKVAVRRVKFHGGSAEVRKARKVHYCSARDAYPYPCIGRIDPGEEYVRSVMFPNHDASGSDRPEVRDTCRECAQNYLYLDRLDVAPSARWGGPMTAEHGAIRESIERGLADSAAGRVHDLGSFTEHERCLSIQCVRCYPLAVVLDLDDPYFAGQTLPDALTDYSHVHSTTGVCVKNARGPLCSSNPHGQRE